jgi:SSS family solute:Na+ symporter/sodium/pantothenate symporter
MVICRQVQSGSTFGYWLVVILFAAVLAAIMSTADSALLTISSIFTKDLYARFIKHQLPEEELTKIGKLISWIVIGVLVGLAILLQENTTFSREYNIGEVVGSEI